MRTLRRIVLVIVATALLVSGVPVRTLAVSPSVQALSTFQDEATAFYAWFHCSEAWPTQPVERRLAQAAALRGILSSPGVSWLILSEPSFWLLDVPAAAYLIREFPWADAASWTWDHTTEERQAIKSILNWLLWL